MQARDDETADRRYVNPPFELRLSRRDLLRKGAAGVAAGGALSLARHSPGADPSSAYVPRPNANRYLFRVGTTTLDPDGKKAVSGVTVDGRYPGPEIRVREGEMLRIEVANDLTDDQTTLHWHGLLVPAGMDGVPGVSNAPIAPDRVYVYEYPLLQSGTYWYHSHWRLQEQIGLAGPFVIEAKDEPLRVDHDVVVFLGDWTHRSPYEILYELQGKTGAAAKAGEGAPLPAATAKMAMPMGPAAAAASPAGGKPAPAMDMSKPDLSDVAYDAFLMNGRGNQDPWTFQARPGERIRLRIINAGASTYFRIRLDGHPLEITHADGLAVRPVTVDHLLMGMAECYDAVVSLGASGSYTLHAVAQDGSGQAIGVLHTPDVEPRPNLDRPRFDEGRALSYADLRAVAPTVLPPGEVRRYTLDLEGDMKRYVWTINGQAYPDADPLLVRQGERVELELVNRTMMWHPMHLHGHFFRVLQGAGELAPLKHTVNVPPRETARIEFTADNPGRWIFHCHNLYHLEAGMARVFEYQSPKA